MEFLKRAKGSKSAKAAVVGILGSIVGMYFTQEVTLADGAVITEQIMSYKEGGMTILGFLMAYFVRDTIAKNTGK